MQITAANLSCICVLPVPSDKSCCRILIYFGEDHLIYISFKDEFLTHLYQRKYSTQNPISWNLFDLCFIWPYIFTKQKLNHGLVRLKNHIFFLFLNIYITFVNKYNYSFTKQSLRIFFFSFFVEIRNVWCVSRTRV